MNGKPISGHALRLAVLHCTHPVLDGADKAILTCLIENGDHGTGENCRPGNRNLLDAVRLTKRPLDSRIDRLISAGLIERTERGDGRGHASVYRIRWRSNHYPDQTPNGELLIDKPGCVDSPDCKNEPGCVDSHDYSETRLLEEPKPGCAPTETGLSGQPHTISAPESKAHTEAHTPASQPEKAAGNAGGCSIGESSPHRSKTSQERWVEFVTHEDMPQEMRHAAPTEEERNKVLAQLDEIGADNLVNAVDDWVDMQSPPIHTLHYGRWKRWLETGGDSFNDWK
jgi:hypothetical protein